MKQMYRRALPHVRTRIGLAALLVFAVLALWATDTSQDSAFLSSEVHFADASPSGLSIVPASCPSDPHPLTPGDCTCALTASDSAIVRGQSTTLSWTITDAHGQFIATISPSIGTVPQSGSRSVAPTQTTVYTLTSGSGFSCAKTVEVRLPQCTGGGFANASLCANDDRNLERDTSTVLVNACSERKCQYRCDVGYKRDGASGGDRCVRDPSQFTCTGNLRENARMCNNAGTNLSSNKAITLEESCTAPNSQKCESVCESGFVKQGNSCVPVDNDCSINADDAVVTYGGATQLRWTTSRDTTTVRILPTVGSVQSPGSKRVEGLSATTEFTLTVPNTQISCDATVRVCAQGERIVNGQCRATCLPPYIDKNGECIRPTTTYCEAGDLVERYDDNGQEVSRVVDHPQCNNVNDTYTSKCESGDLVKRNDRTGTEVSRVVDASACNRGGGGGGSCPDTDKCEGTSMVRRCTQNNNEIWRIANHPSCIACPDRNICVGSTYRRESCTGELLETRACDSRCPATATDPACRSQCQPPLYQCVGENNRDLRITRYESPSCTARTETYPCDYGCNPDTRQCYTGAQPPSVSISVSPSLVRKGQTTTVSWLARNVASCTVRGTNDDGAGVNATGLWNFTASAGVLESSRVSSAIQTRTTYTLWCIAQNGTRPETTETVNVIPDFVEE